MITACGASRPDRHIKLYHSPVRVSIQGSRTGLHSPPPWGILSCPQQPQNSLRVCLKKTYAPGQQHQPVGYTSSLLAVHSAARMISSCPFLAWPKAAWPGLSCPKASSLHADAPSRLSDRPDSVLYAYMTLAGLALRHTSC